MLKLRPKWTNLTKLFEMQLIVIDLMPSNYLWLKLNDFELGLSIEENMGIDICLWIV